MLDGDHARLVAAALPVCAKYGLALAGGYAIKAHRLVDRPSEDIDFVTAAMASMDEIMSALASSYHDRALPRDLMDIHGAAALFSGSELIALCRVALHEEFRLETLRDQLDYAAMYPDEAFSRYGCDPSLISDMRTWAQEWSTQIGLKLAAAEPWSDDGDWSDDE